MEPGAPSAVVNVINEKKIFSGTPGKILKLIGTGSANQVEAARACGVEESYVSQLMGDEDFRSQVEELLGKTFAEQSQIDENYIAVEKQLSETLKKNAQYILDPDQMLRTLKFVNEAKKKHQSGVGVSGTNGNTHTITERTAVLILPEKVAQKFILNPMNEIVGVDGREMVTLPSGNINALSAKIKEQEKQRKIDFKNGPGQTDPWSDL